MACLIQSAIVLCLLLANHVSFGSITVPMTFIGGRGGSFISKQYTDGRTLKKLEVWAGGWQLRSVKFHWSNGHVDTIGKTVGRYSSFAFTTGEHLTSLSLWGNGGGTRCGAFKMRTNKNSEYFPRMTSWRLKREYHAGIGSGIIIGFAAKHGSDVDALGFRILRPIRNAVLENVRYPDLNLNTVGLQPWNLESVDYRNAGYVPQTFTLKGKMQVTISSSWTTSSSLDLSVTLFTTVKAGIPIFFFTSTAKTESTWKVGLTASYKREQTSTFTKEYQSLITVGPRKHLKATGTAYEGPISTKYSGTMHIILDNGQSFRYGVSGYYKGATSTRVYKSVKETNI